MDSIQAGSPRPTRQEITAALNISGGPMQIGASAKQPIGTRTCPNIDWCAVCLRNPPAARRAQHGVSACGYPCWVLCPLEQNRAGFISGQTLRAGADGGGSCIVQPGMCAPHTPPGWPPCSYRNLPGSGASSNLGIGSTKQWRAGMLRMGWYLTVPRADIGWRNEERGRRGLA